MAYPHTLLIVEDDPGFASYLKRLLRDKELRILMANSGQRAIEYLTSDCVDLVLQDIGLPDIDGYQVMDQIHQILPEALIIVMTGEVTVDSAIQALRHGAYDYLRKPFEATELFNTIDNALDRIKLEHLHKEAQEKLRESEERYRQLFNSESDAVAVLDAETMKFEDVNHAAVDLFEYSKKEFLNLCVLDISAEKQKTLEKVKQIKDNKSTQKFVPLRHLVKKDGKIFPAEISTGAFIAGGRKKIIGTIRDITETKQLEHQLLIKNKMLSLGRVAAGIAHEIRNPLTGINTYLYTIEDLCDSDQLSAEDMEIIRQVITQIQVASNKIESVIKRVMDFSKPGAPKMVCTDINESLKEAIELSAVTMRKNGIKIEKSLASGLPQCYADPRLIEQVVLNLITNAARAMENSNGNPKLVRIKSSAKDNTLSIQVADSGPGVPDELSEKIFDPFFTTKEDGSGIGLNIAQRIVADHNGTITLGGSQWGGAEFTIKLPIERRMNTR
jgi:PAS domain S-box-containing protein